MQALIQNTPWMNALLTPALASSAASTEADSAHQPQYESVLARTAKQGSRRVEIESLGDKLTIIDLDAVPTAEHLPDDYVRRVPDRISDAYGTVLAEGASHSSQRASFSFLNGCKCVGALSNDGKELRWENGAMAWHRDKDRGSLVGRWYAEEPRGRHTCWFDRPLEPTAPAEPSRPMMLRQMSRMSQFNKSFNRSFTSNKSFGRSFTSKGSKGSSRGLDERSTIEIPSPGGSSSEMSDFDEEDSSCWDRLRPQLRDVFVHPSTSLDEVARAHPGMSLNQVRVCYRVMWTVQ